MYVFNYMWSLRERFWGNSQCYIVGINLREEKLKWNYVCAYRSCRLVWVIPQVWPFYTYRSLFKVSEATSKTENKRLVESLSVSCVATKSELNHVNSEYAELVGWVNSRCACCVEGWYHPLWGSCSSGSLGTGNVCYVEYKLASEKWNEERHQNNDIFQYEGCIS